jgi:hypothetical protein
MGSLRGVILWPAEVEEDNQMIMAKNYKIDRSFKGEALRLPFGLGRRHGSGWHLRTGFNQDGRTCGFTNLSGVAPRALVSKTCGHKCHSLPPS